MSTAVPSKRQLHPNTPPPGRGLGHWLGAHLRSTVGMKFLVALTGIGLTLFVIGHLVGNLAIFKGREALNNYAAFLKDQGPLLWAARIVLLTLFILHMVLSLKLRLRSAGARPIAYSYYQNIQASPAARYMVWTGVIILLFTAFHIAHYTLGVVSTAQIEVNGQTQSVNYLDLRENPADPKSHHDVYAMTWFGFHHPLISVLYILAQLALILHLSHGVASTFQSLGLNTPRLQLTIRALSWAVALFVGLGNIIIVLAVWFNVLPPPPYVQ
jgi:succinate dehydrogenase / fumarate reductase, cytochrome b subunit